MKVINPSLTIVFDHSAQILTRPCKAKGPASTTFIFLSSDRPIKLNNHYKAVRLYSFRI